MLAGVHHLLILCGSSSLKASGFYNTKTKPKGYRAVEQGAGEMLKKNLVNEMQLHIAKAVTLALVPSMGISISI